jgi:hypothetical protein
MRTGHFALAILLAFGMGAITAAAQNNSASAGQSAASAGSQTAQPDPLAAAARRAREAQKNEPKAAKVYTNDNLPTNATISVVGVPPSSTPAASNGANGQASNSGNAAAEQAAQPESDEKRAQDEAALASAKAQLESEKKDLDIDQRKYALDDQMWLSSPNHDGDSDGAANLQSEQDAIGAKQDEVTAAQKVVDDLEARLNTSPAATTTNNSSSGNSNSGSSDSSSNDASASSNSSDAGSSPATTAGGVSLSSN